MYFEFRKLVCRPHFKNIKTNEDIASKEFRGALNYSSGYGLSHLYLSNSENFEKRGSARTFFQYSRFVI